VASCSIWRSKRSRKDRRALDVVCRESYIECLRYAAVRPRLESKRVGWSALHSVGLLVVSYTLLTIGDGGPLSAPKAGKNVGDSACWRLRVLESPTPMLESPRPNVGVSRTTPSLPLQLPHQSEADAAEETVLVKERTFLSRLTQKPGQRRISLEPCSNGVSVSNLHSLILTPVPTPGVIGRDGGGASFRWPFSRSPFLSI
jgi:hypothetical protein